MRCGWGTKAALLENQGRQGSRGRGRKGGTRGSRQGAARAGRGHRQGKRREQVRGSAGAIMLRGSISDRGCQIEQDQKKNKRDEKIEIKVDKKERDAHHGTAHLRVGK